MVQRLAVRGPFGLLKTFVAECTPRRQLCRALTTTIQRGPVQKLDFPNDIPQQYWPQIPKRFRPDVAKREIVIHEPPPSETLACKDPVAAVDQNQQALLDPSGARARLFNPKNRNGAKPGDVLLVTFKTGETFPGVIISIKQRGPHTSVLLRNHLTSVGTEMQIKVFSPLVQSMEIAQKAAKRKRRARLYYLRQPKHDMGSVQKIVDQYLRQRALLTGVKVGGGQRGSKGRR